MNQTKIIVITALILLGGGGAAAYYKYAAPSKTPEQILKESFRKSFVDTKSFSFTATSTGSGAGKLNGSTIPLSAIVFAVNGAVDYRNPSNLAFSLNSNVSSEANSATTTGSLHLALDTIYAGKNVYVNLKDFAISYNEKSPSKTASVQTFLGLAKGFAPAIENKWIQIGQSTLQSTTFGKQVNSPEYSTVAQIYSTDAGYTLAVNDLGDESLGGRTNHHYKVTFQNSPDTSAAISKILLKKTTSTNQSANILREQELAKSLSQKVSLEIWIGKNDERIYKVVTEPITATNNQVGTRLTTQVEAVFDNYGKAQSITVPQGSTTLEQLLQGMFSKINIQKQ